MKLLKNILLGMGIGFLTPTAIAVVSVIVATFIFLGIYGFFAFIFADYSVFREATNDIPKLKDVNIPGLILILSRAGALGAVVGGILYPFLKSERK